MTLEEQVLKTIEEYDMLPPGTRVLVGVSGGADSVCLLTLLNMLYRKGYVHIDGLRAIHVHHGLRASADEDEQYVRKLCGELEVPLAVYHVDAAAEAARRGMSVEEAGRTLRRETFRKECAAWDREFRGPDPAAPRGGKADAEGSIAVGNGEMRAAAGECACRVALAHHMEDSAETLLFNLCRGSSAAGLAGIRPVSVVQACAGDWRVDSGEPSGICSGSVSESHAGDPSSVVMIRPLIRVSRGEIEAWLTRNGWTWRTDESNTDIRYTRNYLRQEILPALEEHVNAGATQHLARAALDMAQAQEALREETRRRLAACQIMTDEVNDAYSVPQLKENSLFWRRRMLYEAFVRAAADGSDESPARDVTHAHVGALLELLETTGTARIDLPHGMRARKEYDVLTFEKKEPLREMTAPRTGLPLSAAQYSVRIFPYRVGTEIPSGPCTKWFDYDTITQSLSFRGRREGDVLALGRDEEGGWRYKKLSRVMIDRKVPERLRDAIVLPMDGCHVLWFPGYRIGAEYRITEVTRTVLEIRLASPDASEERLGEA